PFLPGTFTNQVQATFQEPQLPLVTDPRGDHRSLTEASYVNLLATASSVYTDSSALCRHCLLVLEQPSSATTTF
ncbi:40s ribosomal protein sa-like, partial [Lynx pardinus]